MVQSGYIGAGSGQPVPIEYLPAEHRLSADVRLVIEYQGRPTTTIAVGDMLRFKLNPALVSRDYGVEEFQPDIFATNVIAKDPYTGRSVELIDSRGLVLTVIVHAAINVVSKIVFIYRCPVDPLVFPRLRMNEESGGLETTFSAFKIPDSNFMVFEAKVKTCSGPCPKVRLKVVMAFVLNQTCSLSFKVSCNGLRNRRKSDERQGKEIEDNFSWVDLQEMIRVFDNREEIKFKEGKSTFSQQKVSTNISLQRWTLTPRIQCFQEKDTA